MKKILALILAAVLCAALFCGCTITKDGDNTDTSGNNDGNSAPAGDLAYVKNNGKIIIGVTVFQPMDWQDNGEWVGFDAEMAKKFAEYLGVDAEFMIIADWSKKAMELDTKGVDVVWNGMTLTDEVKSLMGTSEPYCKNAQIVVVKKELADSIKSVEDLKSLTFAVENGSAGAKALAAINVEYTAVDTQDKALMEVSTGASQACVVDLLMAGAMIGEGTSMPNLTTSISLTEEEYGVGFRKNSNLVAEFNKFWKQAYDNGTVMQMAEKYGISKNIIAK
ncbi:MAG: transporter substrate-binding domain-containing protein [Clostridia bacterium]|nr:transporter substrate-binding domain-containing protein [Clostridia bacterium]